MRCLHTNLFPFHVDYEQITKFLQGYIDNDVNLNNVDTCTRSCSDYKLTASYDCHPGTLCASNSTQESLTRCFGSIRDCYELDNSLIEVCHTVSHVSDWKQFVPLQLRNTFTKYAE